MRDKKVIDAMILSKESLPTRGSNAFDRYESLLRDVLRENVPSGARIEEVLFCPACGKDPACFAVDYRLSWFVSDQYPLLRIDRTFVFDPTLPLMPQMLATHDQILAFQDDLCTAAKAITKARDL